MLMMTRGCSNLFTSLISFNPHNSELGAITNPISQMRKLSTGVTHLVLCYSASKWVGLGSTQVVLGTLVCLIVVYFKSKCFMWLLLLVIITVLNLGVLNKCSANFTSNGIFASSFQHLWVFLLWLTKMSGTFRMILNSAGSGWYLFSSILSIKHFYNIKKENLLLLALEGRRGEERWEWEEKT